MSKKRGVGRPSAYKAYVAYYNELKKNMKKHGLQMAQRKLTKREWEAYHTAMKNDRQKEILEGKRKIVGNINRDLAKRQQWGLSAAQARAQQKAIKVQTGKTERIRDIRAGKAQVDWDAISAREKELRNQGWGWARVHDTISEEFFGS